MIDPLSLAMLAGVYWLGRKASSPAPTASPPAVGAGPKASSTEPRPLGDPPAFGPRHVAVLTEAGSDGVRRFRPDVARGLIRRLEHAMLEPIRVETVEILRLLPPDAVAARRLPNTAIERATPQYRDGRLVFVSLSAILPLGSCEQIMVICSPSDAAPLLSSPHLALLPLDVPMRSVAETKPEPKPELKPETVEPRVEVLPAGVNGATAPASSAEVLASVHLPIVQ